MKTKNILKILLPVCLLLVATQIYFQCPRCKKLAGVAIVKPDKVYYVCESCHHVWN